MEEATGRRGFRRRRGTVLAWIAVAAWMAYWIHDETSKPPPTPIPAWLHEPIPWPAWELPVLVGEDHKVVAGAMALEKPHPVIIPEPSRSPAGRPRPGRPPPRRAR